MLIGVKATTPERFAISLRKTTSPINSLKTMKSYWMPLWKGFQRGKSLDGFRADLSGGPVRWATAAFLRILETDRKSTRLNSSHVEISYAVFCLKKKKKIKNR